MAPRDADPGDAAAGGAEPGEATRFRAREGLVASSKGEARYLTDLESGAVFELNATALEVFEHARGGLAAGAIVERLAEAYPEVPRDELARDAREVLAEFVRAGLLVPA